MDDNTTLVNRLRQYIGKASFSQGADDALALSVSNAKEVIAQRDARIEELEAKRRALAMDLGESLKQQCADLRKIEEQALELAALKAQQPSGVVLPERREVSTPYPYLNSEDIEWNARLNSSPVSAGPVVGYQFQSKQIGGEWETCNLAAYLYRRGNNMFETRYTQLAGNYLSVSGVAMLPDARTDNSSAADDRLDVGYTEGWNAYREALIDHLNAFLTAAPSAQQQGGKP